MSSRFRFSDGIEVKSQTNQYKRHDVFRCGIDGHKRFEYRVSVYHVLKEKRCYPHGCIGFRWRCTRLPKGLSCPRGFRRAGRLCFGCKFFIDEKVTRRPRVALSPQQFEAFKKDLRDFENWLEGLRGKEVNYSGTVSSVKPHLTMDRDRNRSRAFHGFLVVLKAGFVNLVRFDDYCYLRLSGRAQDRLQFRPGDRLDFFAYLGESRGRIVLTRLNRIEIEDRGQGPWWNESRARVAVQSGTLIEGQPERCLHCERGCLIDIHERDGIDIRVQRRLFCLEGVRQPALCPYVRIQEETEESAGAYGLSDEDDLEKRIGAEMGRVISIC